MVAAHSDHTRKSLAMLGLASYFGVRGGLTHEDTIMAFLDLLESPGIVVSTPASEISSQSVLCWWAYDVTGISPQSIIDAQLLNGFAARGTLYPPLKRTLREP